MFPTYLFFFFFFNDTATTEIYTLSLHDALPITEMNRLHLTMLILFFPGFRAWARFLAATGVACERSENTFTLLISYSRVCTVPSSTSACKPGSGEHALLSVRCGCLDHLLRRTLFLPIGHVGQVRCDRGAVTDLHRRVGLLAGAHAVDEIGHVIPIRSLALKHRAVRAIDLFRIVINP